MIGIMDYDFCCVEKKATVPSLGAMKVYSYFRLQHQDVQLITTEAQLDLCKEVYFFSNKTLDNLPFEIITRENIRPYGRHFGESLTRVINHCIPDVSLYKQFIQTQLAENKMSVSKGLDILDSTYYQAYVDGEKIPLPPSKNKKKFYIYDVDFLGYQDCWEILDEIMTRKPSCVYMLEPIQCHTIKQFFFLREEYEKVARTNQIILDFFLPQHDFDLYFGTYKLKLLGEITTSSKVSIYLGKNYGARAYKEIFYMKHFHYILNLLFSYYSRNIPISLIEYDSPPPEADNPFAALYANLISWSRSPKNKWDTKLQAALARSQGGKEQLKYLLDTYPGFKSFMNYSKNDLKDARGIWRLL